MSFCATREHDIRSWDYLQGQYHQGTSVGANRWEWLQLLAMTQEGFQVAMKDPVAIDPAYEWTKWKSWYSAGWNKQAFTQTSVITAYDVHRSLLENEIVVESDMLCKACAARKQAAQALPVGCPDCYGENLHTTMIVGRILEEKGYVLNYYFSGNKSIHVHIYLDFSQLLTIDKALQEQLLAKFTYKSMFLKKFMGWLRMLLATCYGTRAALFDEQLAKGKHLIRAELSRNKAGYKTFLGNKYKELPLMPRICNEENQRTPLLGSLHLSRPYAFQELIEEFLVSLDKKEMMLRAKRREGNLMRWLHPAEAQQGLKSCMQFVLSDAFKEAPDGFQRAMFLLANELKQELGGEVALGELRSWNERMGFPCTDGDLTYRILQNKTYHLSHQTIHEFLASIGFGVIGQRCTGRSSAETI